MSTLHRFVVQDRSAKVAWTLEELGVSYEVSELNFKTNDHKSDSYLKLNPLGQSPTYIDDNGVHTESVAIAMYLGERYIEKGLAPAFDDLKARGEYYFWTHFSASTMDSVYNKYWTLKNTNEKYQEDWTSWTQNKIKQIFETIESRLGSHDYLINNKFSIADICVSYVLNQVTEEDEYQNHPKVMEYFKRCSEREACKKISLFS
jgi:glutathione S-transferase